jgi:hypothetical protein
MFDNQLRPASGAMRRNRFKLLITGNIPQSGTILASAF